MGIVAEDFDEYVDELTSVIAEIQRLSRKISVQKAQCSRIIIWCHDVVNMLREAEEDEHVYPALNEFHRVLKAAQTSASSWSQPRLNLNLGLLLVPIIDHDIELYLKSVLTYTNEFPSIFVSNREQKWRADLERCRTRDRASNRSTLIALIDGHEDILVLATQDQSFRQILDELAKDLDIVEEWSTFVSDIDNSSTSTDLGDEEQTPKEFSISAQEAVTRPESLMGASQTGTRTEQQNIELFWDSMLNLEEKADSDPAFGKELAQLRKLAQATMISTDEGVTGRANASLMKHIAILKPPPSAAQKKSKHATELSSPSASLSIDKFTGGLSNPSPETSLLVSSTHIAQVTHVLEYLKHHPLSDRFRLCTDISEGLAYMHSQGVVLGDFAPYNVTVDESGLVQLRELNLSSTSDHRALRRTSHLRLPDARYIPPEVITLPLEQDAVTDPNPRTSDVYAFTLLLYEILSGLAPWDKLDIPSIVSQVTRGNRPTRPSSSKWLDNDELWALLQSGWHQEPEGRPDMASYSNNLDHWRRTLPYPENDHNRATIQEIEEPSPINTHKVDLNSSSIGGDITFDISHQVRMVSSLYAPYAHGGFCDVFIGRRGMEKVAMKRLRIATIGDDEVVKKRFIRECEIWRKLKHPNVLEFYGMVRHAGSLFMISPFLDDGDAPTWLESRCGERLRVLIEAARGCLYLHTLTPKPTVHGDLKGANILIKADGEAVLSDFGLSKTMNAHTSHGLKDNGTGPYMAPELFAHCNDPDLEVDSTVIPVTKTLETDVFAFGRTAIELLSGQVPYGKIAATPSIWYVLLQGKRPARPNTPSAERWITDAMWAFINEMTHVQPECRPTMAEVVARLERFKFELDLDHIAPAGPQDEIEFDVQGIAEEGNRRSARTLHLPPNRSSDQTVPSKGILKPSLRGNGEIPIKPPKSVQFAAEFLESFSG